MVGVSVNVVHGVHVNAYIGACTMCIMRYRTTGFN